MSEPELPRREQLLADAAMAWLDGDDEAAAAALLRDVAARHEFAELERTAALVMRASSPSPADEEPSPDLLSLTARLQAAAFVWFATDGVDESPRPMVAVPRAQRAPWLPWLLAAASITVLLWRAVAPSGQVIATVSAVAAREALLQSAATTVQCAWQPGPSALRGTVHGDVVWNALRQEGYLRLAGLPPLDASRRYQLWIVDATREGPPVDGGLFDVPKVDDEAVIRVAARLPVGKAAAFVLTVEAERGVVVSQQQEVVAIARP